MKIIQQPDILSFAGNMNDFVIEDVAKSLVFKLSVDGMVIVDEVYVAEGGEVRVSMKDIVDCFLSISIPRADSDYIIQSLAVKKFKAEIEDSVIEFTVVKGGISNVAESSAVFLKTQWLTLQPQEKRIVMHQPEYLSYYAMVACLIKMTVYLADGSANETLLALEAGNLYTVDVSYLKISGKFDRVVGCYDVWVENEAGQRLTYVQRYILSQSNTETNVYLFENTLGGIDSVVFTGRFTEKIQTEGTVTTVLEESTDSDIDLNFSCEQNTGFIPSIDYARWLRSFFVSKQRYHVAGALRRIYLRESENGFTKNSLNDFTFEFFYSKQTKYDVVTRNRDDLPHLLEFPEVDSIPFLAPRLAEFPIAVVADDLMLPVQYAFENAWRRISIAAITQAVSEGAIDKIDLSSYWKKTELVRDGLYLKFLDKYIRAKFADDSTLWDGNAFDDYLDQAVKRDSSVRFKDITLSGKLLSDDFLAGALGTGFGIFKRDSTGKSYIEIDKIFVRLKAIFAELEVRKLTYAGGNYVFSPAGMTCVEVQEFDTFYRCFFTADDGEKAVENLFRVDDLVQARESNIKSGVHVNVSNRYYWRRCIATGDDYIDLSKTDCDVDSAAPEAGDALATIGNKTDVSRQNAIIISVHGEGSPSLIQYKGINDYSLSGKAKTIISPENNEFTGKFKFTSGEDVEDKFGQTDSQMNNLQGQLTNQQGQLNTQQGQITNIQTDILAIPGQIKQEVSRTVTYEVGNLQIGMVNLLKGSNVELNAQAYQIGRYAYDVYIQENKEYTCVICYTLGSENTYIGVYTNSGSGIVKQLNQKGSRIVESFTFKAPVTPAQTSFFDFYQFPNGTYGSKVHWVVLVEGNKGPNAWIPSLSEQGETAAKNEMNNLQIGGINLADYSGGDFLDVLGLYDSSYASKTKIDGKNCLQFNRNSANCRFAHVMVEDGEYTFSLWVKGSEEYDAQVNHYNGSNYGSTTVHVTTSWERKVITFTAKAGSDIIHFGTKNTIYITDWKYEKGNKATDWSPSIADQNRYATEQGIIGGQDAVDNLQIGTVNLVSRKMMLAWNEKNKDIAVWGQDSDGIYLNVSPGRLFDIISTSSYNPIFTLTFKPNTQYVFSVEWKHANQSATGNGLAFYIIYTDGTRDAVILSSDMKIKTRVDLISARDKTIFRISSGFGNWSFNALVYSLALYESNKVLAEPPVATEDLTGQSNVNLVDGGKEVTVTSSASDQWGNRSLVIPKLKPNTVYYLSFKAENLTGSPTVYSAILYNKEITTIYHRLDSVSGGIMITPNNFIEGEAKLFLYAGKGGSTAGNSVKYKDVMLVEGFTPPSSYSPSPGDVQKEIDDVSDAVTSLQNFTDQAFADGIITRSEAQAIASNINVLNAEKADIDAYYTKLYANAYLTGTAKTNLASAKTAYNTAHTNLINSINTAIADGKATATEKADVNAKFSAYNNALSAYQTRVGEADKAIQDTIKKVADDAQTSANTAQSAANAAQSTANQAQADANAANSKLTTWASDNYISPQEKTGLKQQKSDIQSEQKDIEANANRYGISLASYMAAYNAAMAALNKYTATSPENIAVSSDYNNIAAYYPARQTILNSIAAAAKAQADKATWAIGMDGGKMLYADPEFKKGLNGVAIYGAQNNGDNGKGTVVLSRISKSTGNTSSNSFTAAEATHVKEEAAGSPHNGSDWCLYIKAYGGSNINHLGGFAFGNLSRANAVFIVKVSAKIPVGYTLVNAHNAHGTGSKHERLTPMAGTGKYETYIFKETCGPTGTFSSVNYLHLFGPVKPESDPLEWFVDYATVFDLTADGYGDIVEIAKTETVAGINNNPDSVTVYAKKTDFNSLNQVVNQQGSQLQVNTNSIDAIVTKNGSGTIVSIKPEMVEITGATVIQDGNGNKVNIFGIGDKVISVNGGVFSVDKAGKVIMQNAEVDGTIRSNNGEIGGMKISNNGIRSEDFNPRTLVGSCYARDGLSVYASGILAPSSGALQAGRVTAIGSNALIVGMEIVARNNSGFGYLAEVIALKLSAINDYSNPDKLPVALDIASGNVNLSNGILYLGQGAGEMAVPHLWTYSSKGTIPTANRRLVYVQGNTGGDNPCTLGTSGAKDGQVITIVNTSTSHRVNITGTAKGNHWILEGCCGTFRYLAGYGLWYPERFSW